MTYENDNNNLANFMKDLLDDLTKASQTSEPSQFKKAAQFDLEEMGYKSDGSLNSKYSYWG